MPKKMIANLPAGTTLIASRVIPATADHIGGIVYLAYRQDPRTSENNWQTFFERGDKDVVMIHDFGYDRDAAENDLAFRITRGY